MDSCHRPRALCPPALTAGSDFIRLFWALSKWMAGSYGNRSTEHLRRTIQHRIKTVIQKQRGGWRKRVCPKPTINMRTVSAVWVSQDSDTLDILLIYSLHLTLLFLHNSWHHLSYLTVFTFFSLPWLHCQRNAAGTCPCCSVSYPQQLPLCRGSGPGEAWVLGALAASWVIPVCSQSRELTDPARNSGLDDWEWVIFTHPSYLPTMYTERQLLELWR